VVACGCEAFFGPTLAAAVTELVVAAGVALAIEGLCLVLDAVQSAAVATSSASPRGRHVGAPFVNVDAG